MGLNSKNREIVVESFRPTGGSGRPLTSEGRHVSEDIVSAAEKCLESKSPQEISTKDIAVLANTNPAMVYYYFGSKDGLLVEIVRRGLEEIRDGFLKTRESVHRNELPNPTRSMIEKFAEVYNRRPALCRILISEVFRDGSPVRSYFFGHWPDHGKAMVVDVVAHLSSSGYYKEDVNVENVCTLIYSVVFFPLIVKPSLVREREQVDRYLTDQWIDFVAAVLDSYLRSKN